jgi:hypothetical protein
LKLYGSECVTGNNKSTHETDFRVEVVGSNPADPTTRRTGPANAKIFKTLWALKKSDYSEATLKAKGERLRYLAKHVNLNDHEAVKEYISSDQAGPTPLGKE